MVPELRTCAAGGTDFLSLLGARKCQIVPGLIPVRKLRKASSLLGLCARVLPSGLALDSLVTEMMPERSFMIGGSRETKQKVKGKKVNGSRSLYAKARRAGEHRAALEGMRAMRGRRGSVADGIPTGTVGTSAPGDSWCLDRSRASDGELGGGAESAFVAESSEHSLMEAALSPLKRQNPGMPPVRKTKKFCDRLRKKKRILNLGRKGRAGVGDRRSEITLTV